MQGGEKIGMIPADVGAQWLYISCENKGGIEGKDKRLSEMEMVAYKLLGRVTIAGLLKQYILIRGLKVTPPYSSLQTGSR